MKINVSLGSILLLAAIIPSADAQMWMQTMLTTNANWYAVTCSADGTKMVTGDSGGTYGVWVSTNSGMNWTQANAPTNENWAAFATCADGTKMFAVNNDGVWASTDTGMDWNSVLSVGGSYSVACSTDGSKIAAVGRNGVFTSTNSAANWTPQTNAPASSNWRWICSSADGSKLTAVFNDDPNLGILISTNSGVNWSSVVAPTNANWQTVVCTPDGVNLAADGNGDGLFYVSTNSGMTWTEQASEINQGGNGGFSVAISADGTRLTSVGSRGIFASTNAGVIWFQQTNEYASAQWETVASSADGGTLVAANYANGSSGSGSVDVFQAVVPPRLSAATTTNNVTVSWIVPSQNFLLQKSSNLSKTNWLTVTNIPVLNLTNLEDQIAIPASGVTNIFYRLQLQ